MYYLKIPSLSNVSVAFLNSFFMSRNLFLYCEIKYATEKKSLLVNKKTSFQRQIRVS